MCWGILNQEDFKKIQSLRRKQEVGGEKIMMSYLHVTMQYSEVTKQRELVKDKDSRDIPITAQLREELQQFLTGPDRYLFSFSPKQSTPLAANTLNRWLYARMEEIGLKNRIEKRIVFHSKGGRVKSEKKAAAARENGKKGGRPREGKEDFC